MLRSMWLFSLVLLALPPLRAAEPAAALAEEAYRVIYPKRDRSIAAALAAPARLDHSGLLRDVLAEIADAHRIPIVLAEQAVVDAGLSFDERIELVVENADLASTLKELLKPYGLTYLVEDGVLKITTEQAAAMKRLVRAYDVAGLLDPGTTADEVSRAVLQLVESSAQDGTGGVPQVVSFKTLLIVVGTPGEHERVEAALEIMSQVGGVAGDDAPPT